MRRLGRTRSEIGPVTPKDGHAERLRPPRIGALFSAFLLLVAVGVLLAVPSALSDIGPPTISSDQADYAPGATVTLTGSNWQPGEAVHISVNDSIGQTWSYGADVTADAGGGYTNQFQLPTSFVASYLVTATGLLSGTAMTTFTDSAANIDQCENGGVGDPLQACVNNNWTNGNVNGQKAHWAEDEFLPYRVSVVGITSGPHTLSIGYDTVQSDEHAIDYLGSFDATETTSSTATLLHANNNDPCGDLLTGPLASECTPGSPTASLHIPDPTLENCADSAGTAPNLISGSDSDRRMKIWGPANTQITAMSYPRENVLSGTNNCSTTLKISFTVGGSEPTNDVVLAWSGHIARGAGFNGWGDGNGATSVNGSPYHMRIDNDNHLGSDKGLDGASQGAQDLALQAGPPSGAIIPSSTITIIKHTLGGDDTFGYSTTGAGGLPPSFNITTSSGTGQSVNNGINPGSYTINESTIPGGWNFVSPISCSTTGGATAAPDASTQTQADITIPVTGGATVTCTYTNAHTASVKVVKSLDPTSDSGKFNLQVNGVTKATDVGNGGTTDFVSVPAGTNPTVGEIAGTNTSLNDYASSIACTGDSTASGSGTSLAVGTLSAGQSATCTITNHRKPQLRLKKVFDPTTDTGKVDFTQNGVGDNNGSNGYGNGQMTAYKNALLDNNTASEAGHTGTDLSNYVSEWSCDDVNSTHGTGTAIVATDNLELGYGAQVTCTFTNHRKPQLKVKKVFDPTTDTGKVDFTQNGVGDTNGSNGYGNGQMTAYKNALLDNNTASEAGHTGTDLSNYVSEWSCDDVNSTHGTGTAIVATDNLDLGNGAQVTCTFTNHRKPQLKVKKVFDPTTDTGKVDFTQNGVGDTNGSNGYGNGQMTAYKNALLDNNTASEAGHTGTDLSNYVSEWSCDDVNSTHGSGTA